VGVIQTAVKNQKSLASTAAGSVLGPFVDVSLSLLTLHYLPVGVASIMFSLVPVCIIPLSIFLHKEHVSKRAFSRAVIAVFATWILSAQKPFFSPIGNSDRT
jgi:drug/metabolite transporter (DMT)-like permease